LGLSHPGECRLRNVFADLIRLIRFEQLALYTHQQGIAHRLMDVDDMFPKGVMTEVII
jgi:hypothetical protein